MTKFVIVFSDQQSSIFCVGNIEQLSISLKWFTLIQQNRNLTQPFISSALTKRQSQKHACSNLQTLFTSFMNLLFCSLSMQLIPYPYAHSSSEKSSATRSAGQKHLKHFMLLLSRTPSFWLIHNRALYHKTSSHTLAYNSSVQPIVHL